MSFTNSQRCWRKANLTEDFGSSEAIERLENSFSAYKMSKDGELTEDDANFAPQAHFMIYVL